MVVARSMADLALQIDKHADPHRFEATVLEEGDMIPFDGDAELVDGEDRDWAQVRFGRLDSRYRHKTSGELALEAVSYHLAQAYEHITRCAEHSEDLEDIAQAARVSVAYAGLARMLVGAKRSASWRFNESHLRMHAARIRGLLDKERPAITPMQVLSGLMAESLASDQEHTDLAAFSQAFARETS